MKMFKVTAPQMRAISHIYEQLDFLFRDDYKQASPADKEHHVYRDIKKLKPIHDYYKKNKMRGELWVETKEPAKS